MRKKLALVMAIAFLAIACGGDSEHTDDPTIGAAGATCAATGGQVSISAENLKFDKSCLAVPADQEFIVNFDNKEPLPHNVAILEDGDSSDSLFSGDIITGPKKVAYRVKPLPPGTYRFDCSVHPTQMEGTFIVR